MQKEIMKIRSETDETEKNSNAIKPKASSLKKIQ